MTQPPHAAAGPSTAAAAAAASKPSESHQTPLQILPAMLHAVFCQTADVFNTPQRQQPRAVIHTNAQLRTSVSACNERFQYALDLLEMDILKAKATLRRDLSALRAAEEAREAEAAKERERERAKAEAEAAAAAAAAAAVEAKKQQQIQQQQLQQQQLLQQQQQQLLQQQQQLQQQQLQQQQLQQQQQQQQQDIVMADTPAAPAAPPAPMQTTAAAQNFDDFLASFPVGVGGVQGQGQGQGGHDDGGMGGGQPLEDSDIFAGEFNDLFGYGGT